MMLIKLSWRNIWRNKKRSIITIIAIVIAVFLAVVMRSLQLGVYDNMIQNIVGSYSGHIQIHSNGYWKEQTIDNAFEYNDSLIEKIEIIQDVDHTTKRLQSGCLSSFKDLILCEHHDCFRYVFLKLLQTEQFEKIFQFGPWV